ncbi:DUF4197 domain-containing protein [Psychroflexus salis]|uniref:DUF4197 domain-containing protein n=1 Tax=Psychroflexus salis TaxID=1526574 RepID=A0A916ZP34_9FLAO|nr:DUF4197 domain-containing protein [Psychroflexus salis]GGE07165.1 hypothetical protein GCM10010831_05820 [Psychroflexus salis]
MKRIVFIMAVLFASSCAELQQIADEAMQNQNVLSNADISTGLKQALSQGVEDGVQNLAKENGFLANDLVKIMLPEELTKLENTLRRVGLGSLADEGVKMLNRAAEDAVAEATPVFLNAIQNLTINDAKNILMGTDVAATNYLKAQTQNELYQRFQPIIENSFTEVGADQVWANLINRYNQIPLTQNVNPNLTDYVTQEALKGVFVMVEIEEKQIRERIGMRKTELMKKVFALQD